jgi:hypothetical protein
MRNLRTSLVSGLKFLRFLTASFKVTTCDLEHIQPKRGRAIRRACRLRQRPAMPARKSVAESLIVEVRGQRVILASSLADIYGVQTRALNQAVRRNRRRFPADFAFRLTRGEADIVRRSRSQIVILKRGQNLKHLPLAFTEHGAIMAASVLKSTRAIQMSVLVVRAFLRLREWSARQAELATRLDQLEQRVDGHDDSLAEIIGAIRRLVIPADNHARRRIGFAKSGGEAESVHRSRSQFVTLKRDQNGSVRGM